MSRGHPVYPQTETLPDGMHNEYFVPDNAHFNADYPVRTVNEDDTAKPVVYNPPTGMHMPYRGSEEHGVEQVGDPSREYDRALPDHPQNLAHTDVPHFVEDPNSQLDIPVVQAIIIDSHVGQGVEHRFATNSFTITGNESGPIRVAQRNRLRKKLKLSVQSGGDSNIRVSSNKDTVAYAGFMMSVQMGILELEVNGPVFVVPAFLLLGQGSFANPIYVSVIEEYTVEAQGKQLHPLETGHRR